MSFVGSSTLKTEIVKVLLFVSKNKAKYLLQVYLISQSNQSKMNASTKFGNILFSGKKPKPRFKTQNVPFQKSVVILYTLELITRCLNGYT